MSEREPPMHTAAWWRNKTDADLEDALRGGPIGNKSVDGAIVEINRRAGENQALWAKRGFWAALVAAIAAIAGAVIAAWK
jgi:hypothetical protein